MPDFEEKNKQYKPTDEELDEIAKQMKKAFGHMVWRPQKEEPKITKWLTKPRKGYAGFVTILEDDGETSLVQIPESCDPTLDKKKREFRVKNTILEDV